MLYADAVYSVLALLGTNFGTSAYYFTIPLLYDDGFSTMAELKRAETVVKFIVFAAAAAYLFAGLAIANGQKIGWKVGVAVAGGAVALPILSGNIDVAFGSNYVITYLFNIALLALLLHPMSRNHQRIWFEGKTRRRR